MVTNRVSRARLDTHGDRVGDFNHSHSGLTRA